MTWSNTDKTKWLDLEKVSYWQYASQETQEEANKEFLKKHGKAFHFHSTLMLVVDGATLEFEREEADEIYKLLSGSKKKLLKG